MLKQYKKQAMGQEKEFAIKDKHCVAVLNALSNVYLDVQKGEKISIVPG